MALAINIYCLLNKKKIESNRIEFKKGWNPYYYCLFVLLLVCNLLSLLKTCNHLQFFPINPYCY